MDFKEILGILNQYEGLLMIVFFLIVLFMLFSIKNDTNNLRIDQINSKTEELEKFHTERDSNWNFHLFRDSRRKFVYLLDEKKICLRLSQLG